MLALESSGKCSREVHGSGDAKSGGCGEEADEVPDCVVKDSRDCSGEPRSGLCQVVGSGRRGGKAGEEAG